MTDYTIKFNDVRSILEITVEGFWDQGTIARFMAEFSAIRADLRSRGVIFGLLGDASRFAVQAQEIMQGMTALVDADNQIGRSPSAVVAGSALAKIQIARTMAAPHVRVFATRNEALAWLDTQINRS